MNSSNTQVGNFVLLARSLAVIAALAGKAVRLRFMMKDADVFAFRFAP